MQKIFIFIYFLPFLSLAGPQVNVYYEQVPQGYKIYADTKEVCPVSVKINFSTTNLRIDGGENKTYVIEGGITKQLLTTLSVINKRKAYKFSYTFQSGYGDVNKKEFDIDFVYDLPFAKGGTFKVGQGYKGTFSHVNENAIDFTLPIGTEILAIRDGIVVKVIQENNRTCAQKECEKYNNYILIYHSDGTFAEYAHIKKDSAFVKVGDKINNGEKIALSGNVGYSSGPHLHLVVFKDFLDNRKTLRTKFKTGDGEIIEFLKEKETYSRMY